MGFSKNAREIGTVLTLVAVANNSLGSYWDFFKAILHPPIHHEAAIVAGTPKWLVPPQYHPGWLQNAYLDQQDLPPSSILEYPGGIDTSVKTLTLNHPTIKTVVKNKMENLLARHNDPNASPELLGDFLESIYNDFQNRTAFPESYTEAEKTQAILDLTFLAATSVTNQFWTADEARNLIGVELPDGYDDTTQPMSVVYLDRQPRLFAAPLESCLPLLKDVLWRCVGADRAQHVNAHRHVASQFGNYLETRNPKLINTNVELGTRIIQFIADLPLDRNTKLELLSNIVGLSWEAEESGKRTWTGIQELSPIEVVLNPARVALTLLRTAADNSDTGYGDLNVTMDILANNEGVREAQAARGITNDAGARTFFRFLNNDKLNGKIPIYTKNDPRVAIFQNLQVPIIHLAEISRGLEIPSITNQAFIDRAISIGKKLRRLSVSTK